MINFNYILIDSNYNYIYENNINFQLLNFSKIKFDHHVLINFKNIL